MRIHLLLLVLTKQAEKGKIKVSLRLTVRVGPLLKTNSDKLILIEIIYRK